MNIVIVNDCFTYSASKHRDFQRLAKVGDVAKKKEKVGNRQSLATGCHQHSSSYMAFGKTFKCPLISYYITFNKVASTGNNFDDIK